MIIEKNKFDYKKNNSLCNILIIRFNGGPIKNVSAFLTTYNFHITIKRKRKNKKTYVCFIVIPKEISDIEKKNFL